eukprot:scaffold26727_cov56-Phaeocystis_antarctica.AAC.3
MPSTGSSCSTPALRRRKASGTTPFSQYGVRSCSPPSPEPPFHTLFITSFQNCARWPLRPSAWSVSCLSSHPLGVTEPTGSGLYAYGVSAAAGAASSRMNGARARGHGSSLVVNMSASPSLGSAPGPRGGVNWAMARVHS